MIPEMNQTVTLEAVAPTVDQATLETQDTAGGAFAAPATDSAETQAQELQSCGFSAADMAPVRDATLASSETSDVEAPEVEAAAPDIGAAETKPAVEAEAVQQASEHASEAEEAAQAAAQTAEAEATADAAAKAAVDSTAAAVADAAAEAEALAREKQLLLQQRDAQRDAGEMAVQRLMALAVSLSMPSPSSSSMSTQAPSFALSAFLDPVLLACHAALGTVPRRDNDDDSMLEAGSATTKAQKVKSPAGSSTRRPSFLGQFFGGGKREAKESTMEQCRADPLTADQPITDVFVVAGADCLAPEPGCFRISRSAGGKALDLPASIFVKKGGASGCTDGPIVALAVVLPDRGERVPPGFTPARAGASPSSALGNLNPLGEAVLLCVRRAPHGHGSAVLVDLGVALRGEATMGAQVVVASPAGHNADFDHFSRLGPCVTYRQALPRQVRAPKAHATPTLPSALASQTSISEEGEGGATDGEPASAPPALAFAAAPSSPAVAEEWRLTLLRPLLVALYDRRPEVGAKALEGLQALLLRHNFFLTASDTAKGATESGAVVGAAAGSASSSDPLLCLAVDCLCENCLAMLDHSSRPLKLAFLRSAVALTQAALPLRTVRLLVTTYLTACEADEATQAAAASEAGQDQSPCDQTSDLSALAGYTCLKSLVHALLRGAEAEMAAVADLCPQWWPHAATPAAGAASSHRGLASESPAVESSIAGDVARVVAGLVLSACRVSELSKEVEALSDAVRRGRSAVWLHFERGAAARLFSVPSSGRTAASQGLVAVLAALAAGAAAPLDRWALAPSVAPSASSEGLQSLSADGGAGALGRKELCLAAINDLLAASGPLFRASPDWGYVCRRLVVPVVAAALPPSLHLGLHRGLGVGQQHGQDSDSRLLRRCLACLTLLWRHFRRHLRLELGTAVTDLLLPVVVCRGAVGVRASALGEVAGWVDDKSSLVDMFLNFDANLSGGTQGCALPLLERVCGAICAVAEEIPDSAASAEASSFALIDSYQDSAATEESAYSCENGSGSGDGGGHLQLAALEAVGSLMRCLLDLCGHAYSTALEEAAAAAVPVPAQRVAWGPGLEPVMDGGEEEEEEEEDDDDDEIVDEYHGDKEDDEPAPVRQGSGGRKSRGRSNAWGSRRSTEFPLRAQAWPPKPFQPSGQSKAALPAVGRERKTSFAARRVEQQASAAVLDEGLGVYRAKGLAKAVAFLTAKGFIADTPRDVATFLRVNHRHFTPSDLGDYLGSGEGPHWEGVRAAFVSAISFRGLFVEQALRTFLTESHFRLPGEAQKVDRLICCFANCWWADNPAQRHSSRSMQGVTSAQSPHPSSFIEDSPPTSPVLSPMAPPLPLSPLHSGGPMSPAASSSSGADWWQPSSVDAVYLLAFATIMLNTDLHRAAHKKHKKMTKDQFIHNLSRSDTGLPAPMLDRLYDSVLHRPIQMSHPPGAAPGANPSGGAAAGASPASVPARSDSSPGASQDGPALCRQVSRAVVECEELWRSLARDRPRFHENAGSKSGVSLEVAGAMFGAVCWQARSLLSNLLDRPSLSGPMALAALDLLQSSIGAAMLLGLEKETLALALLLARTKSSWEMLRQGWASGDLGGDGGEGSVRMGQEPWFLAVAAAARRSPSGGLALGAEQPMEAIASHLMPVLVGLRALVESDGEAKRRRGEMERVAATVDGGAKAFLGNPRRWLVKEGDLVKRSVSTGKQSSYRFWLFSDVLAYGHRSVTRSALGLQGQYKVHHLLLLGHLRAAPDHGPCDLLLIHPLKTFAASAANEEERDSWLLVITQTSAACMRPGMSVHGGSFAGMDMDDDERGGSKLHTNGLPGFGC